MAILSRPRDSADAFLTADWDNQCADLDRSNALAMLMLSGLVGAGSRLHRYWNRLLANWVGPEPAFAAALARQMKASGSGRRKITAAQGLILSIERVES
jgi:hypothetical protein